MLGRIYYKKEWHLMRFLDENLEILHEKSANTPLIMKDKEGTLTDERLLCAVLEDYKIYFFDIESGEKQEIKNDYFLLKIKKINYFIEDNISSCGCNGITYFQKLSFINGVIKPMIELSNINPFSVNLNGVKATVKFVVEKYENEQLINLSEYAKMIPSNRNIEYEYKIELIFENAINTNILNEIILSINKFIGFFNFDFYPYIQKIRVETNTGDFFYYNSKINYEEKYIKRWNYIQNCPVDSLKKMIEEIPNNEKYDIGFLKLLSIKRPIVDDIYCLAKSVEKMGEKHDSSLNQRLEKEIKLYKELKEEIAKTIDKFEENKGLRIEEGKRSFVLGLIEMPNFRQKVEYFLQEYNEFAENYKKYPVLTEDEKTECSKKIKILRNTIHGNTATISEEDKACIDLIIFALYYHILKSFNVSIGAAFNLLQMIFSSF